MTIIYVLIILLQLCVIVYFVRRGQLQRKKNTGIATTAQPDTFEGHREVALSIKPEQLNLNIPDSNLFVYGLVMDWNMGDEIVTLATYITGATNLYLSKGGGVIAGGLKPNVGEAAVKLVSNAQDFVNRAMPMAGNDIPPAGCVRFNLLTNRQVLAAQEHVRYFDDGSSPWFSLFQQGNEVIAEMKN